MTVSNARTRFTWLVRPALALALASTGCQSTPEENEEAAEIAAALELDDGGLDVSSEAPEFGDKSLYSDFDVEEDYTDSLADSDEVMSMSSAPDAAVFHTTMLWGQLPGNPDAETPRKWDGTISVSRGAIVVRRVVAFEGPTDELLPRTDPQSVSFRSATLPHRDGLRLDIIDPSPESSEPLVLTYATAAGPVFQAPIGALTDGPQTTVVDEADNRIVAVALPRPIDVCEHGMLGGRWHRVAEGRGRLIGIVAGPDGAPVGHVKGIYGRRASGEKVVFGKYINLAGEFRGIFHGHYGNGHFAARWKSKSGDRGGLGGEYRETIPGPETGGHFLGRWAERTCNLMIGPPQPAAE